MALLFDTSLSETTMGLDPNKGTSSGRSLSRTLFSSALPRGGTIALSARAGNRRKVLLKRPARPCKNAVDSRFTVENAKGVSPPRAGPDSRAPAENRRLVGLRGQWFPRLSAPETAEKAVTIRALFSQRRTFHRAGKRCMENVWKMGKRYARVWAGWNLNVKFHRL